MTTFQHATVRGLRIFYREAGSKASPTIVLLHGFPSSSHMFRDLIPQLADRFHVIAPDYVGFGYSDAPDARKFDYTFDNLAAHIDELLFGVLGLKKFSIYVQDYGAPVGYRISSRHQDAIEGIVVQNGNAYAEGIGAAFDPMKPFWANRNSETEKPVRELLKKETTIFQYTHGVKDVSRISPDSYTLDQLFLDRPGNDAIQLNLLHNYQSNLALYAALKRTIARTQGPVIVAGHAYAGAVIATAHDERVKALVYVAALAPDEGETVAQVFYKDETHPQAPQLAPDPDGFIWMPDEGFANAFAQNATDEQIALSKAVQRPIALKSIQEPAPVPAWKSKPTWYLLAEEDRMINPKTQRFMAERMNATVRSFAVDHTPLLTAPDKVVDIILEAAKATLS